MVEEIDEKNMAVLNSILKEGFTFNFSRKKSEGKPKDINQVISQLFYIAWGEGYLRNETENIYWKGQKTNEEGL
jgi:hypothetical protein